MSQQTVQRFLTIHKKRHFFLLPTHPLIHSRSADAVLTSSFSLYMLGCEEKGDGSDFIHGYWSSMESGDESLDIPSTTSNTERDDGGVKFTKILIKVK